MLDNTKQNVPALLFYLLTLATYQNECTNKYNYREYKVIYIYTHIDDKGLFGFLINHCL